MNQMPISDMAPRQAISATPKVIFAMKDAPKGHPGATVVIDSPRVQDGCRPPVLMLHPVNQGLLAWPLWPDHPRCRHHGWLVHPCDPPRRRAPGSARSYASRLERSGRLYGLRQRLIRGFVKNCAWIRGRSDRLCGPPPRPVAGSARRISSRPARPYRPCWRSAVDALRSLTQNRDSKSGRPELVPEPLLLSSTKTTSGSLNPASTRVSARPMPRRRLESERKVSRDRNRPVSSSGLRFRADDHAGLPGRAS